MTQCRVPARCSFVAATSLLLGCSSTTNSPGTGVGSSAGTAGQSATHASAGAAHAAAGTASGTSGGALGTSGGALGTLGGALGTSGGASGTSGGASTSASTTASPGFGGSSSLTASGGTSGIVVTLPVAGAAGNAACDPTACAASARACQSGVCQNGVCTLVNRDAGTTCEGTRVCSGTGFCADCVPTRGKCEGRIPSVCNAEGHWVASSACGLGDQCSNGACISPKVGWALSANGTGNAEMEDLALMGSDSIVVALHAEQGIVNVDGKSYETVYPNHTNVAIGVSRATGHATWNLPLQSTDWAFGSRLGVATDTSFIHAFRFKGSIDTYSNPNSYGYGAFVRGYNAARAVQFTEVFNPNDGSVGPTVEGLEGFIAQPNGAFALLTYETGLAYGISDNPGRASITEANAECATVLFRLNAVGIPSWKKQFDWCTDNNPKVLRLGPNGDLFIGGAGCRQNGGGAAPVLDSITLKSAHSGVIARLRATDGSVVKVVEFEGISTSYGRVDDLGFLPDGSVIALVSASNYMTFKIGTTVLPGGTYLVKLDSDLNLVKYQFLGTPVGQNAFVTDAHLAIAPNGVLYVTGTFTGDFDFGGGSLPYLGSCERCAAGDAFVASFSSDFAHRWSRAISSASYDHVSAVVAENGRAYASVSYGATVVVDGTAYAPTASYVRASTLFTFVE